MDTSIGNNWLDIRNQLFTDDEILKSDARVSEIGKLIDIKDDTQFKNNPTKTN